MDGWRSWALQMHRDEERKGRDKRLRRREEAGPGGQRDRGLVNNA